MASFRDTAEFKRGREGERVVADLLKSMGYYIIPSYDYVGEKGEKAPKLQGFLESFAVPDLDTSDRGRRAWIEVKTKTSAIKYRIKNELRHGLESRLWEHYRKVQDITACSVEICIYELDTKDILKASLDTLGDPVQRATHWRYGRGEVALWPRNRFQRFANVADSGRGVRHEKFGFGIVRARPSAKVCIVEFEHAGSKRVLDSFLEFDVSPPRHKSINPLECGR